jgi:5'(3')-deoxyribonucleotidase
MKRVIVDMDGVIADLLPTWLRLFGERTRNYIHPDTITSYGFEQFIPENSRTAFFECLGPALDLCPPMRGTSMLHELCNSAEVVIATYVHPAAAGGHGTKLRWLKHWFPAFDASKVTFMNGQRAFMHADYIIDDNPAHIDAWLAQNPAGEAFMVKHTYNWIMDIDDRCTVVSSFDDAVWEILAASEKEGILI